MVNKKNILRFSLSTFVLASAIGIFVALDVSSDEGSLKKSGRATAIASILGVLGISSFFVGLAYPKDA